MDGNEASSAANGMLGTEDRGVTEVGMPLGGDRTATPPYSPDAPTGPAPVAPPPNTASMGSGRQGAAPTAPTANGTPPPPEPHLSTFDKILDFMGAKPKPTYTVDPTTHKLVQGPPAPMTTEQRIGMIAAAALTGLSASQQQPGRKTMLSTFATGAGAGLQMEQGQDQAAKQEALANYQRGQQKSAADQEAELKKAQIFETNQRTALLTRQTENAEEETQQHYIDHSAPLIEAARGVSAAGQSALRREHLTQAELLQEHSAEGARHATSNVYLPDGRVMNPQTGKFEFTFSEIDPNAEVDLDPEQLDLAHKNGLPIPGYTPGTGAKVTMPITAAAQIMHYNQGIKNFENLANGMNGLLGLSGKDALNADELVKNNPAIGQAFSQLAGHWDGQESTLPDALKKMGADPKLAPYARTVVSTLGGDKLQRYEDQIAARKKATEKTAEEQAGEPFEESKEARRDAAAEERDQRRQDAKDQRTQGYAEVPGPNGTNQVMLMSKADADRQNYQFQEMKAGDINKDRAALRQLNDVQTNQSRYTMAAKVYADPTTALTYHGKPINDQNPVDANSGLRFGPFGKITSPEAMREQDKDNLNMLMNKAGWADFDASIAKGGEIKLPVISALSEKLSRQVKTENYAALSDQGKELYDGFIRMMSAIPAYQRALTNIGRSNKEMLDLELANIAPPIFDARDIVRKQAQFQENIDRASQGYPANMVGLPHPGQVRARLENPTSSRTAQPATTPAPGGGGFFEQHGGKTRQAAQPAPVAAAGGGGEE